MDLREENLTSNFENNIEDYVISKKFSKSVYLNEHSGLDLKPKTTFDSIEEKARELFEQNLISQSESLLKALHAKGLGSYRSYSLLGSCYHQQNLFKKALKCYQKALQMKPSDLETLTNLSLLRLDLGDYKKGYIQYQKASQSYFQTQESEWKHSMSEQHYQFGMKYYKQGYYHEALLEFLKVVPVFKNLVSLELLIIRCLWNLNQKKKAFQKLHDLQKKYSQSIDVLLLLGEFYFYVKKITFAISKWERVLKMDPQNQEALKWLSKTQNIQSVEEAPFA